MTYGSWYDRTTIEKLEMQHLQVLSCMGEPGGGRAHISNRVLSQYHVINYTDLDFESMSRIYRTIAEVKFNTFAEDIKGNTEQLATATIQLFERTKAEFKTIPSKQHYTFNMRDISKVFEGLFLADSRFCDSKEQIVKMWAHEVLRVFYDRLVDVTDQAKFKKLLDEQLFTVLGMTY